MNARYQETWQDTDHRKAMLRAMVTYLLENGKIETTVTRAKEVRSMAEKMITLAKEPSLHAKRMALAYVTKEDVVKKLFDEIAPKYKDVNGGYCRIIKTGPRRATQRRCASSSWSETSKNSIIKEKPQVDHSACGVFIECKFL